MALEKLLATRGKSAFDASYGSMNCYSVTIFCYLTEVEIRVFDHYAIHWRAAASFS
jgi:hypothetical protein